MSLRRGQEVSCNHWQDASGTATMQGQRTLQREAGTVDATAQYGVARTMATV